MKLQNMLNEKVTRTTFQDSKPIGSTHSYPKDNTVMFDSLEKKITRANRPVSPPSSSAATMMASIQQQQIKPAVLPPPSSSKSPSRRRDGSTEMGICVDSTHSTIQDISRRSQHIRTNDMVEENDDDMRESSEVEGVERQRTDSFSSLASSTAGSTKKSRKSILKTVGKFIMGKNLSKSKSLEM